jgi:hypothetical protein
MSMRNDHPIRHVSLAALVSACCGLALLSAPLSAQAGIVSDAGNVLNDLLSLFQPQQILQVGKALNTGQMQQLTAQEQEANQKLQEQAQAQKEMAAAEAKQEYLSQTNTLSQLPGGCNQSRAAASFLQSAISSAVQGAGGNAALGDDGGPGVIAGKANLPTQQEKIRSLSALSGGQVDANALFEGQHSGNALTVESTLLDPLSSQPVTLAQSTTPAGVIWRATHNSAEAGLSLAASSMGLVAGLHAVSVPASAVNAISSVAAPSAGTSAASAGKPNNGSGSSSPSKIASVATRAPVHAKPASPASQGNWRALVPRYADMIARVAREENISPAIIAATIAHEDTNENLSAMPCGNPSPYDFDGTRSLMCVHVDSSAKSLGQMIDPTAISNGANYGLTNPMVVYGKNPEIELKAMASGLKLFLSQCGGNVECTFAAWNYGHVASGMPHDIWPNTATGQYAARSMQFYTGQKQVPVGSYQGGASGNTGGSPASTAGLLRLVSLGSYANKEFYEKLAETNETGAWRTMDFLDTMTLRVSNQNRRLMERLSAIMAARVALSERENLRNQNGLRSNAVAQGNGAMSAN